MPRSIFVLLLATAFAVTGCGSGTPASLAPSNTVPVNGSVTYKSKPAVGFKVTFHPQFDIGSIKFTPYGETDAQGKFTLSTGAVGNGAPPGKYKVTVEKMTVVPDRKSGIETEVDTLKGKYGNPSLSNIDVEVKAGDNTLEPFRLD